MKGSMQPMCDLMEAVYGGATLNVSNCEKTSHLD